MKFALVIIETEESRLHIRDRRADQLQRIEAWMAEHAAGGTLIGGEAFETEAVGPVTIRHNATGERTVIEAPFAGDAETLGGYLLVETTDRHAAITLAQSWPTEETIEIRPIWVSQ